MEHARRKSNSRQRSAPSGLHAAGRQNFRSMFHTALPAPFDKAQATGQDDEGSIPDGGIARRVDGDEPYNAKVTVLGDYLHHHPKARRNGVLAKAGRSKLDNARARSYAGVAAHHPHQNHLLAALDPAQHVRLFAELEPVQLPLGFVVCQAGSRMEYAYFPTTAIISNFYELESGASAEISVTGCDGLVGIALLMGGETTTSRAVVRNAGLGYRVEAEVLKREFEDNRALRGVLLRYTQALITQMAQIAVCNCHHNVEQQLCRLLLFSLDRLPTQDIALTQELIASLLGVRRESVTEVAGKLQAAGLIRYNRGHITVLDKQELESRVCECYGVVKSEFARLLPRKAGDTACHPYHNGVVFTPNSRIDAIRRCAHAEHVARRLA